MQLRETDHSSQNSNIYNI